MSLPNDPVILLSYINTLLRDKYPSYEELCKSLCVSADDIEHKLNGIGYVYDPKTNSFKQYLIKDTEITLYAYQWEGL